MMNLIIDFKKVVHNVPEPHLMKYVTLANKVQNQKV